PRPARFVVRTYRSRPRLRRGAGCATAAPRCCRRRRRNRPLLRPRHLGDGRLARSLPPLRRSRSLGESRRHALNRAADVVVAGLGLPRPTLAYQVERYTPRQRRRLDVKPGITGWAQVHGRARLPWDERIELDVWYVEHRSPLLDLQILARTPVALFGGTYKGETGGWRA